MHIPKLVSRAPSEAVEANEGLVEMGDVQAKVIRCDGSGQSITLLPASRQGDCVLCRRWKKHYAVRRLCRSAYLLRADARFTGRTPLTLIFVNNEHRMNVSQTFRWPLMQESQRVRLILPSHGPITCFMEARKVTSMARPDECSG
jgi:hypothetical protein